MTIANESVSPKFAELLQRAMTEYEENLQHDTKECQAWNALIAYVMTLEKGQAVK